MPGIRFSEQEKIRYIEEYKKSYLTLEEYTKKTGLSEQTLKKWIQEERNSEFGAICFETTYEKPAISTDYNIVFACENIRIELKENFNKEFLRKIVEVLINDK